MSAPPPGSSYRQAMPPNVYQQVPSASSHHGHSSSVGHGQEYYGPSGASSAEGYISAPPLPPLRDNATHHGVQTGQIGGGFGPYAFHQGTARESATNSRFSSAPSESSFHDNPLPGGPHQQTNTIGAPAYLWDSRDPDLDDALHNPDPKQNAIQDAEWTLWSPRGWANYFVLFTLLASLITLFAGYPVISYYTRAGWQANGYNLGGINGTGQIPVLDVPSRIDKDTPEDVYTRTGSDGQRYNLVFSDEFNKPGRSFYPGDDPFWEAVDFNYWPTEDIEWYDPGQATTQGGSLVLNMVQEPNHNMNFKSAMLQSWNKFCFTGGYIEAAVSLPGTADAPGFWPGVWTMGNLGRAGYGATTEGLWPYSYDTCDLGTFPNQTDHNGNPANAATGNYFNDGPISFLPGQRLSACTCEGSDHPGPHHSVGRAAPEIDILEAQIDIPTLLGQASQSLQTAPFDYGYRFIDQQPATTIYNGTKTLFNTYKGGVFQEALSALTFLDSDSYVGSTGKYSTYGFEYWPSRGDDGFITWYVDGAQTWTVTTASLAPNDPVQISQRLIPEEPMYVVLNFGMSPGFQGQDFSKLKFPAQMRIDYVRVYQRDGHEDWSCSPDHHPTEDYINSHANAYTNPNLTTWDQAGYTFPRNSAWDGC